MLWGITVCCENQDNLPYRNGSTTSQSLYNIMLFYFILFCHHFLSLIKYLKWMYDKYILFSSLKESSFDVFSQRCSLVMNFFILKEKWEQMVICRVVSPRSINKNEGHRLLLFIKLCPDNQSGHEWLVMDWVTGESVLVIESNRGTNPLRLFSITSRLSLVTTSHNHPLRQLRCPLFIHVENNDHIFIYAKSDDSFIGPMWAKGGTLCFINEV
jgi:hypothetical protein